MIIEHPEQLMKWLTVYLEPLCDADPGALAKYVLALLKKEKPEEELRKAMEDSMFVFLQEKTKEVLDDIFEILKNNKYMEEKEEQEADSTTPSRQTNMDSVVVVATDNTEKEVGKSRRSPRPAPNRHEGVPRRHGSSPRRHGNSPTRSRRSPRSRSPRSPDRRRSSDYPRHRYRSRSPEYRRVRRSSPLRPRRRSRSNSYSPPTVFSRLIDEDSSNNPYKRVRCRDYDEQGFCMKGDQCKFDHGNDAVVVTDQLSSANNAVGERETSKTTNIPYQPSTAAFNEPYVPASTVSLPPLNVPPPGFLSAPKPLELPLFPPPPITAKLSVYDRLGHAQRGRRGGRGRGMGGRGIMSGRGATQIVVRNIPFHLNTIAHMNNHFARFGNLVNVQVHFEGDPASALISFSSPEEADMAYNCPDMIMGNKFIRMFFHHPKLNIGPMKRPFRPREQVSMEGGTLVKTVVNEEARPEVVEGGEPSAKLSKRPASPPSAALKKFEELLETKVAKKREAEENQSEKLRKLSEIQKSKQEILYNLIEEQKKLITKLEASKGDERTTVMELIKTLTSAIEKAKMDLEQSVKQAPNKKKPAEIQKDLLDAELELFQAQQEGVEGSDDVQKRVNNLRLEAAKAGLLPTSRGRGRGMRGGRGFNRGYPLRRGFAPRFRSRGGRGRGALMMSIDRRPSKIAVTNLDWDHKEEIIEHFQTFGVVLESYEDEANDSLIVQFRSRKEAETAMNGGKIFKGKPLHMTWHKVEGGHELSSESLDTSSNNASLLDDEHEHDDEHDDYQPLDPTYLPPGLHDEGENDGSPNKEDNKKEDDEDHLDEDGQAVTLDEMTKEEEEALLAPSPKAKEDVYDEEEDTVDLGRPWKP